MNCFLRGVDLPSRFYSPERETLPPRIAALSEEQRYFYTEWLRDIRKRRAQVRLPTPAPHYLTLLTPPPPSQDSMVVPTLPMPEPLTDKDLLLSSRRMPG